MWLEVFGFDCLLYSGFERKEQIRWFEVYPLLCKLVYASRKKKADSNGKKYSHVYVVRT